MAVILGGGLGGLSTGYYLLKNNLKSNALKLFLLEATEYCGGWIKTIRTKDYIFEQGPRTIRPKGVVGLNTLNMMQDLGLSEHIVAITPDHPAAKNRMIYVNKTLYLLPSSLISVFQKRQPFTKPLIYAALNDLRQPQKSMQEDSIYNFVERRFGKEIADYAISPIICGICAGDAKEISVKFLMKTLFEHEQNHGSVIKGMVKSMFTDSSENEIELSDLAKKAKEEKWNVYTLKGGLDIIPERLKYYLLANNVDLQLNTKVEELDFVDSSLVNVKKTDGQVLSAKHVYSSLPSHILAKLLKNKHPELSYYLNEIPFVTVGIVNLYFSTTKTLISPAFGFLVPPVENSPILGVVFDSCCIPDQNGTVLTVMMGGKWFNEKFGPNITKEQLYEIAIKEVKTILKIDEEVSAYNVNILEKCIPQYIVGHYTRVDKMREYIRDKNLPLSLVGSSYDGVGINDVIYSAKTQVTADYRQ